MKRFMFGLFVFLFSLSVYAAPTVNIIPNKATYQVGDAVLLSVSLSQSPKIHGGGLNIRFNPNVLQARSVVIDNVWGFANRPGVINNTGGSITDILFVSFNDVEGELPVAIIQMAVVGNGDSGFSVSESVKNPFADTNGQLVSFSINSLFSLNTTVAEPATEETPEDAATQTAASAETETETVPQPADQTTEQTTALSTSSDESAPVSSNSAALIKLSNNASGEEIAANSQNDRQFYLPSGSGAIPIDVTDDDGGQTGAVIHPGTADVAKNVDEYLPVSEMAASDEQGGQVASEVQSFDDTDTMEAEGSMDSLILRLIVGVVFLLVVVFTIVFYKRRS